MKKIIAFLSAIAMVVTMFTTVSFAADNEVVFDYTVDGTTVVVDLSLKTTYSNIRAMSLNLNLAEVVNAGATITTTNGCGTVKYTAAQKMVTAVLALTEGDYVSGTSVGTFTISGVSEDFAISLMAETSRIKNKIGLATSENVIANFGTIGTDVVVKTTPAETETTVYYTATAQNVTEDNATGVKFTINTTDPAANGAAPVVKDAPFAGLTIEAGEVTVALAIENILASVAEQYVTVTAELY